MSVPAENMDTAKLNEVTGQFNVGDALLRKTLLKKIANVLIFSPVRHASTLTNIATSSTETTPDKLCVAANAYAYIGHLPLLFGKAGLRFAPGVGQAMLLKDGYGVLSTILDAGEQNNIDICKQLNAHRKSTEAYAAETFTQAWLIGKARMTKVQQGSGHW